SASAECVACKSACQNTLFDLEKSVGDVTRNGTTLLWTVGSLTEWDPSPDCYYNTNTNKQCCSTLPVIVYQPPESVSFSFINHTGPMFEHDQYTLQCTVENVAPVGNLVVTFYRGQTALDQQKSSITQQKPVSDTFTLNINISREDNGAQYWCEAKLELGPEGPQRPPVVASENITATVYWSELTSTTMPPTTTPTKTTTSPAAITTMRTTTTVTTTTRQKLNTTTTASATTTKTSSGPNSSATIILIHRFIMCLLLLFLALV
ncbi:integumentary mucin C.1-like, partial [Stegastes partitus]|uniref:Integumentary mucin C.1-like n=1 Tax=Stegastes partitus TaxID=144197 RepID=A0A9Y4KLW1_9TELE